MAALFSRGRTHGLRWLGSLSGPGAPVAAPPHRYSPDLHVETSKDWTQRELYRVLSPEGEFLGQAEQDIVTKDDALALYTCMVRLQTMDKVFFDAQRQGRISFYMTSMGEEGCVIGTAAGLRNDDEVFAQYREQGVLMWRGSPLQRFADQLFGNSGDLGKGRQMPVHYGSKELNFQTISSPLATQIPQAAGAAYSFKLSKNSRIAACYFGEGAASEGDFHAGMNFAATLGCPVLFICRNNGYAISTPAKEQYSALNGIVDRARGYGMASIVVDGNDVLAVREATRKAREYVAKNQKPLLLEAFTYRVGHHSTSDDSTRYRSIEEIETWRTLYNPITRLQTLLEKRGWLDAEKDKQIKDTERAAVIDALIKAEKKPKGEPFSSVFEDVYAEVPANLKEQREELKKHLEKYPHTLEGH